MPIISTNEVKEKRNNLLTDTEQLRDNGCSNDNLIDRLYFDYGWDFIDYKELFSCLRELCLFLNITESDANYCWLG